MSLEEYLRVHDAELNRALLHLEEINGLNWHDHFEHVDDYELIRFIDRQIHPTYLRLVEGVLSPLCRIISHFSRTDRSKGTEGLDMWSIMEELERTTLRQVRGLYKHTVRNAIAHGGITFLQREIHYTDKKGDQEKYGDSEIIRMCDDLLDGCNALALALSLFLLSRPPARYHLPQQLLLSELREETATPWWEISGCTPSEFAGLNQLIVYARPKTADYAKVQLSAFQSGVLAERFAPGYSRYFFSIRSASSLPGWAAFKGGMLRELRLKSNATLDDYAGVLEDGAVFWKPSVRLPRVLRRLQNIVLSARLHVPLAMAEVRRQLNRPDIRVRDTELHRNGWRSVLNACVYACPPSGHLTQDAIRGLRKRIIRKTFREARRRARRGSVSRLLPLGFAHIAVFCKDYRRRRLSGFGLGPDLVCIVQVQRIRRIRCPDIVGATIEQRGRYRIVWNRAWLETQRKSAASGTCP